LKRVGELLNLTEQKDKRGRYLLQKLSKPRKPTKKDPSTRCKDPALLEELYSYCIQDTDAEWELGTVVGELPQAEYRLWVLDQKINDRGVYVDTEAVVAALAVVDAVEKRLTEELSALTNGRVTSANELLSMKAWLRDEGFGVSDLTANTIDRIIAKNKTSPRPLPKNILRVFQIRQTLARASTKKLFKYMSCCAADSRIHGLLQYHGASTGRWAGRLLQPQNFPRGDEAILKGKKGDEAFGIETLIELIKDCDSEILDAMEAIASALRGMIIAAPGKQFYVADFSAIEARVTAWLFGEEWKLQAFREIDEGKGYHGSDDVYCAAAAMIFGRPIKKKTDKVERQVGKMCELAFGYQGGVGAWRNFDKREPGDPGYADDDTVDGYKNAWRKAHGRISSGWYALEDAAVNCVLTGKPQFYSCITYEMVHDAAGDWLACILPNGRRIWYFNPEVRSEQGRFGLRNILSYEGRNNDLGGSWGRIDTYGGMLTENIVQAISRDLMVEAMIRVELAGYPIVLTIHDEIVSETPLGFGSQQDFEGLMVVVPQWADGCPIHCSGWVGTRYHKE
jgi:DNA polymerase